MYLEKIKVKKDDTILVHFDEDNCDIDLVMQYIHNLKRIYPDNPIIPIIPKYGIERFEIKPNSTGNPYIIGSRNEC